MPLYVLRQSSLPQPVFCSKFRWFTWCIIKHIYELLIFHYYTIMLILDGQKCFFFFLVIYIFLLYFFIKFYILLFISNPLSTILLWSFWNFCIFISDFITNQITVSFSCFLNCFFKAALSAYVADCLAWIRIF